MPRIMVSTFLYGMNEPMYSSVLSAPAPGSRGVWPCCGALPTIRTGRRVSRYFEMSAAVVELMVATTSARFSRSRCGQNALWYSRQRTRTGAGRKPGGAGCS